jgi:hypothetical protein
LTAGSATPTSASWLHIDSNRCASARSPVSVERAPRAAAPLGPLALCRRDGRHLLAAARETSGDTPTHGAAQRRANGVRRADTTASVSGPTSAQASATRRFPVAATGRAAFPEDRWVGAVLRIGEARMRIDKRDQRCIMVNIDPTTTERDPAILRAIAAERAACLGVYGSTVGPGRVAIGDPVFLEGRPAGTSSR